MPSEKKSREIIEKTIKDFNYQWSNFGDIQKDDQEYMNSSKLLLDLLQGFLTKEEIKGKTICEVGSGHGRLIRALQELSPKKSFAVEPGPGAIQTAKKNLENFKNIEFFNHRGDQFTLPQKADFIISIGVIHHIYDPVPVLHNIYENLKKGGKFVFWVYGKEGNFFYLTLYRFLSLFTKSMNNKGLMWFSKFLTLFTYPYGFLCRFLPLPLKGYFTKVFNKFDFSNKALVVFDQLNPTHAKYYSKKDLEDLVSKTPFKKISNMSHRAKYSWTVLCEK